MDISNRFSLEDFLAYFFPGITGTLGLYVLLLLTPLRNTLTALPTDIATGVILLIVSFVNGIILSGFAEVVYRRFSRQRGIKDSIPLQEARDEIVEAFKVVFGIPKESTFQWSRVHFYLCRSLVWEFMPNATQMIQRQSGLRQLRMNLLASFVVWFFTGIGWGIWNVANQVVGWGIALIVVSCLLLFVVASVTVDRMRSNEWREVREVLTAFLAGYKTGRFNREKAKAIN